MRYFVYILFWLICTPSLAQTEASDNSRLGIKTSIHASLIYGTELQNASPKFGYTAGAYYQHAFNKSFGLHTEFVGSFRGSNFKNGIGEYSKVALFYLDLPLMLYYQESKDATNQFAFGPVASYLGLSSLFVGTQKKAEINDLQLKDFDYGVALYYHKKNKITIFQVGAKLGLRNINNGIYFENIKPITGNNGSINNLSFEIGYLF